MLQEGLEKKSKAIRNLILDSVYTAGSGHPGGSFSAVEILTVLYEKFLKFNPKNPLWEERDYFILSKGHAAPVLYATMATYGYFNPKELLTLRKFGSPFQGHPSALKLSGIEISTGSLGQGFGVAAGIALAHKSDHKTNKIYTLLGDGELQEGSVWETAMAAPHFKLSNLCAIVDANKYQIDGAVENIMNTEPIAQKFESFGWQTIEINGHDFTEIDKAFKLFNAQEILKPFLIVAKTIKGKGVDFMENTEKWHGKAPNSEEYEKAKNKLK